MRGRACRHVWLLVSVAAAGCTTRLYPGPKRPAAEVATLETDGVDIVAVDERATQPSSGGYQILAGVHAVSLRLNDRHPVSGDRSTWVARGSKDQYAVCFMARGGHAYLLRPVYASKRSWRPEVIDENTTQLISAKVTSAVAHDCAPESPAIRRPPAGAPDAAPDGATPEGAGN
jgi:hypothetical protein